MSDSSNPFTRKIWATANVAARPRDPWQIRSQRKIFRGRMWLLLIFCIMRVCDALLYFGGPGKGRDYLLAAMMIWGLWTTAIIAGSWFRNDWCRPTLIFMLVMSFLTFILLLPGGFKSLTIPAYLGIVAATAILYGGMIYTLIHQPDIQRLTTRSRL